MVIKKGEQADGDLLRYDGAVVTTIVRKKFRFESSPVGVGLLQSGPHGFKLLEQGTESALQFSIQFIPALRHVNGVSRRRSRFRLRRRVHQRTARRHSSGALV